MTDAITSTANPRVKRLVRLQTQAAERRSSGLFCIESSRELERAVALGYEVVEFYACRGLFRGSSPAGVELIGVSENVLQKAARRNNPEGFVAVLREPQSPPDPLDTRGPALLAVCSGVEKPGNVGAILRSADAVGACGLLIDRPGFDFYNPNCVRSSTGAVFSVAKRAAPRQELLDALRERGVQIAAATPEGATDFTSTDMTAPTAIVLGAEDVGLDAFWLDAAQVRVRVPLVGKVDSLNVSVTAALLLFEARRQREASGTAANQNRG